MIISEMQHKLATWAESDSNRRFDRLVRLIADREWLAEAARIVLASSGARTPGIDGMDKRRMQAGLDHHLADLRTSLLKGTYRPKPVKRIYIPKAKTTRHRLNRGGDRAANSSLHIIAIGRLRTDPRTKAYMAKRIAEGHSKLEIIRCLKRYIAREVFTLIKSRRREINQARAVA